MGSKPQLTAADVEKGLKSAGFNPEPKTGTSHVQWTYRTRSVYKRVTVSAHLAPFSKDLIALMAHQAGMSVNQFYEICSKEGAKKAKRGTLAWLSNIFN